MPYELDVLGEANFSDDTVSIHFGNTGKAAAVFQVRSGDPQHGPRTYTVGPQLSVSDTWAFKGNNRSAYDLSVYGPNGFFRAFKGSLDGKEKANLAVSSLYDCEGTGITLDVQNRGKTTAKVRISNHYTKKAVVQSLHPGASSSPSWALEASFGWYDFTIEVESDSTFQQRVAGHVETGNDSVSDPALGG